MNSKKQNEYSPLISICIPAYKNVEYLKRLLESISIQTFTNFEVIITDDSNDNSVSDFINTTKWNFSISYLRNEIALGSPENWNAVVSHAKGEWIKIMHHDDWFSSENALKVFAEEIKNQKNVSFFYCSYENKYENGKSKKIKTSAFLLRSIILRYPAALLSSNIIGPPSVTIYRNDKKSVFDKKLQWLVDIDFYISYLKNKKYFYIDHSLINIGVHEEQVTKYSFLKPEIEIPEHLHLLNKLGEDCLRNILVYDAFWRLIRNLGIKTIEQFSSYNKDNIIIPDKLQNLITRQNKLSSIFLTFGPFSKIMMLLSYFID